MSNLLQTNPTELPIFTKTSDSFTHSAMLSNHKNTTTTNDPNANCTNPCCFFCTMSEPDSSLRKSGISKCFKQIPHTDHQEHVLVLSGLWNIAMTHPNNPEFPSLGIFDCMANLIQKGINDRGWLLRHQNIYIPYYAAHVIGSYTMNKTEFAEKAVKSGVVSPLLELMRGKISWVEQRVAVRALGHLASYERTFEAVAEYEQDVVGLAMQIASTCLGFVYVNKRVKYQSDLLTRGLGGLEMENRKAEEWASQLQSWSLYLLNCFASKERSLNSICTQGFLKDLSEMWGGLVNHQTKPTGVGLIRVLCYSKTGRKNISDSKPVMESLCNLSRSSDDWQYMGIDCLLLLLKDPDTRNRVFNIAALVLVDLVELRSLGGRTKVGAAITQILLLDFYKNENLKSQNVTVKRVLDEIWRLKIERGKREKKMSEEETQEKRILVKRIKQEGNERFWTGDIEEAVMKYSEALDLCPLKLRKERLVLYSNRAQSYLLLKEPEAAISDATRALCLSSPANSHNKSLWRRAQAYDMKGLAKESLMDCVTFINGFIKSEVTTRIPYYAARMINKQMSATWLFAAAKSKSSTNKTKEVQESDGGDDGSGDIVGQRGDDKKKSSITILSTIIEEEEETFIETGRRRMRRRKLDRTRRTKKGVVARPTLSRGGSECCNWNDLV